MRIVVFKRIRKGIRKVKKTIRLFSTLTTLLCVNACIEPDLKLPAQNLIIDVPQVVTDMEIVWNIDVDWNTKWHYGWDVVDEQLWGELGYPTPSNFEVRRYFLGDTPGGKHTSVDAFTIYKTSFRKTYEFGYYDMLIWSNIDSKDQSQTVVIDESDLNNVTASTTVTRGITLSRSPDEQYVNALFNQPEIFYSAYPRDIHISRNKEDYDHFDEEQQSWVKYINCNLEPIVYIYLVQIVLHNNDGRVKGINGNCALSALASGTSVNTGRTNNIPCIVYFNTRLKQNQVIEGETVDIIGGKLTTYGLCDMEGFRIDTRAQYQGTRTDLPNYLYFELNMSKGSVKAIRTDVTEQCREQCHGGIITIDIDCSTLENPEGGGDSSGSLFLPSLEDYEEVNYDIPM